MTGIFPISAETLQLGIKCTVFERESFLNQRPRDWSFGIYWAHGPLEECLPEPLRAKLNTATVDPSRKPGPNDFMRIVNGKTADELARMPISNVYRLKRSAFRALIVEGLDVQVGSPANPRGERQRPLRLLTMHALVQQKAHCHLQHPQR